METLSEDKERALLSLKGTNSGRVLIAWLSSLLRDDVRRLIQEDAENIAAMARHQGMLLRTQAILHILQAEYALDEDEAN